MRKVNLKADDHNALHNYKALESALNKIGIEEGRSMDIQKLLAGQPQATLELCQTLYANLSPEDASDTPRGGRLATLDPNALDGGPSSRKRKAALPAAQPSARQRRGAKQIDEAMQAAETAPVAAPPPPAAEVAATTARSVTEATLQDQLELARAQLVQSRTEAHHLREEVSFYYSKLERIEDVCSCGSPSKVPAAVLSILREAEGEAAAEEDDESEI